MSDWLAIADNFESKWNFGNCIGTIDGKHVIILAPTKSGLHLFNYKKSRSIVLMAIVNADYEFILVDIGDAGRCGNYIFSYFIFHSIHSLIACFLQLIAIISSTLTLN